MIEDDVDIRELICAVLEQRGMSVTRSASGGEGLDAVRRLQPDLVTLDLGLPDIDGHEVCRQLRALSDAYVIMVSARADEVDQLLGFEIGADDYIVKPFSPRDLRARVGAMMRRPRVSRPAVSAEGVAADVEAVPGVDLGAGGPASAGGAAPATSPAAGGSSAAADAAVEGDLVVDLPNRLASLEGTELELTPIEFALLAAFVGHPKRVWSREALLRSVWQTEWATDTHLVEVHVGNLRRKLGDAQWIRTVRGVGYRLSSDAGTAQLLAHG